MIVGAACVLSSEKLSEVAENQLRAPARQPMNPLTRRTELVTAATLRNEFGAFTAATPARATCEIIQGQSDLKPLSVQVV
jgi:hypothetical protein